MALGISCNLVIWFSSKIRLGGDRFKIARLPSYCITKFLLQIFFFLDFPAMVQFVAGDDVG